MNELGVGENVGAAVAGDVGEVRAGDQQGPAAGGREGCFVGDSLEEMARAGSIIWVNGDGPLL